MQNHFKVKRFVWIVVALCSGLISAECIAADPALEQARALLQKGKANEAYSQLAPLEFERAGDLEYDYLLGLAALDSGNPAKATLAFERVLAVDPNHAGARLDMARAYFALGSDNRAKAEFEVVLTQKPPPAAKAVALKYLAAIDERDKAGKPQVTAYLAAGIGNDDNITSVTTNFTPAAQATYGIPFVPTGNAITHSSPFTAVEAGVAFNKPFSKQVAVFGGLDAKQRSYIQRHTYDSTTLDGRLGVGYSRELHLYRLSLIGQTLSQEGEAPTLPKQTSDRNMVGINGEWRYTLNERNLLGLFAQFNEQRYPTVAVNNVDETLVGASWVHAYANPRKPLVLASIFWGQDKAKNKLINNSDVSKTFTGVRLAGQCNIGDKAETFASVGYQWRNDDSAYARSTLINYGKDKLADLTVGVNWHLDKNWSVQPQVSYVHNNTNIPTSAFDRTQVSIMFRRDFN
jgi:outer membrane protein